MDTKEIPRYLVLTKAHWLNLFKGKRKFLCIMLQLLRRLDRFLWLGLEFNRYPYTSNGWSVYLNFILFSVMLSVGVHRGAYDESAGNGSKA